MSRAAAVALLALFGACGAGPAEVAPADPVAAVPVVTPPSTGNPLIGTRLDLSALRWLTSDGQPPDFGQHRLTLLRWWTVQCPFCRDSLPALAALQREFGERGLGLVAVFHPKGPVVPTDAELAAYLAELGATSAVLARDDRWQALRPIMQQGNLDQATSISILVDREGLVRWVHRGPRLHPSDDPAMAGAAADHRELRALLEQQVGR